MNISFPRVEEKNGLFERLLKMLNAVYIIIWEICLYLKMNIFILANMQCTVVWLSDFDQYGPHQQTKQDKYTT